MKENDLYRHRSFSNCIRMAYELFVQNIKTIFLKTWLPALVLAIVSSTALFLPTSIEPGHVVADVVKILLCLMLYAIATLGSLIWLCARFIGLLNEQRLAVNLLRYVRITFLTLLIVLALAAVFAAATYAVHKRTAANPQNFVKGEVLVGCCLFVISVVFLLPVCYTEMKYLIEDGHKVWSLFGKPYLSAWRYWGFLLMTLFLTAIIYAIIWFIINTPPLIFVLARASNDAGMALGDKSGLPGAFPLWAYIVSVFASFIISYLSIWAKCVQYYAYGNIEAKQRKAAAMAQVKENDDKETAE